MNTKENKKIVTTCKFVEHENCKEVGKCHMCDGEGIDSTGLMKCCFCGGTGQCISCLDKCLDEFFLSAIMK